MKIKLLAFGIAGIVLLSGGACANETQYDLDVETAISRDDNLNRNANTQDEISSNFGTVNTGIGMGIRLSPQSVVRYFSRFKYENYNDVEGLNNAELKVGVSLRHKPEPGFNKPTVILDGHIAVADFETDIRDRTEYGFGVTVSAWVTDKLSARAGAGARIRDSDSRVFDNKDLRLFVNSDLIVTGKLTAYLTFSVIKGDVVSTISLDNTSNETLDVIRIADDIEFDTTFADNELAYRFDATTRSLNGGFNYVLTRKQALDLSFRTVHSKTGTGVDYESSFVNLSYMLRFNL